MSVVSDSLHSSELTRTTETKQNFSSTSVPLFLTSAYQDETQRNSDNTLPKLPSHRFRFSVWHDVEHIDITGDRLHAPRIRAGLYTAHLKQKNLEEKSYFEEDLSFVSGPPQKETLFYRLRDENDKRIHHSLEGSQRNKYQLEQENWEAATHVNISYQELQHSYQKAQLLRILKRLPSAQQVVLINNEIVDMSSISLPSCTYLDLTMNHLLSFSSLPSLSKVVYLKLAQNAIHDFDGIKKLQGTPIEHLVLKENPIAFLPLYRKRIFEKLPNLRYLDGIPRRPQDLQADVNGVPVSSKPLRHDEYLASKARTPPTTNNCVIL